MREYAKETDVHHLILMLTVVMAATPAGCACTGAFHGARNELGTERVRAVSITWDADATGIDCVRMERSRGHGRHKITEVRHEGPHCPPHASMQWVEVRR